MKELLDFLSEIVSIEEAPVRVNDVAIGWQTVLLDVEKKALGGGFHNEIQTARTIAFAEAAERKVFENLLISSESSKYFLKEHPTTCGFAAGFENLKTRQRAIAEAIERWSWSKWIDEYFLITEMKIEEVIISDSARFFYEKFDSVRFFKKIINTKHLPDFLESVDLGIVVGIKDGGVFPGSRVGSSGDDIWEHGLVEAWRHLEIFKKHKEVDKRSAFYYERIFYFGNNAEEAFLQISKAHKNQWPIPELDLIIEAPTNVKGLYVWRAIMKNFIPWSKGSKSRFIY